MKWIVGAALLVGFAGVFAWGYAVPRSQMEHARGTSTKVGTYQNYSYVLTTTEGRKERSVVFSPAIVGDDGAVVGALNELMRVEYSDTKTDDTQPIVEVLNEKPYVTFQSDSGKTLFQLFKNSSGEVGSVKFWREAK